MSTSSREQLMLTRYHRYLDELHAIARAIPVAEARLELTMEVEAVREVAFPQPSWKAILLKTLSILQASCRDARIARVSRRSVEHDSFDIAVPMQRDSFQIFALMANPHRLALSEIDEQLERLGQTPLESLNGVRHLMHIARYPGIISKILSRVPIHWSINKRVRYFGTAAIASSEEELTLSAFRPTLAYSFEGDRLKLRLCYDSRVMNSQRAEHCLKMIGEILNQQIVFELQYLRRLAA